MKMPFNKKVLNIVFLLDTSGSMQRDNAIEVLKAGVRDLVAEIGLWSEGKAVEPYITVIGFANDAYYIVGSDQGGVLVKDVSIPDFKADGITEMAAAVKLSAEMLHTSFDADTKYAKTCLILFSDGGSTDGDLPVHLIEETALGANSTRLAVAYGEHADVDVLSSFITEAFAHDGVGVTKAENCTDLVQRLREATFVAMQGKAQEEVPVLEGELLVG